MCYSTDWEELCDCHSPAMAELLRESFVVLTTDPMVGLMVVVMVVVVVVVTHVMAFALHSNCLEAIECLLLRAKPKDCSDLKSWR